ncbi:hypothetical protein [Shimia biformata]|uniref:hypothetical protein n=1 Tax=Shimia biformata TaxID=1294299 RepID=UPI0019524A09|nr:hypothetical protein [Shimia biformata]
MSRFAQALIALTIVTSVTYGVLIWLGTTGLVTKPEGMKPFDLRPMGYSFDEAQALLRGLDAEAIALYGGLLRRIDTAFPVLLALWLGAMTWWGSVGLNTWSRVILLVVPASYAIMDLAENALIGTMLRLGPDAITPDLVSRASSYTISKYVTVSVAFVVMIAMIIGKFRRNAV